MIPIPTPPTDNLYKFITLIGLVAIVLAVTIPRISEERFHSEYIAKVENLNKHGMEMQLTIDLSKAKDPEQQKNLDRIVGFLMGLNKELEAWKTQRAEIVGKQDKLWRLAFRAGFVGALLGSVLWYYRVQRHQDAILLRDAKSNEARG